MPHRRRGLQIATGCCASTPAPDGLMGSHRAHRSRSPPRTGGRGVVAVREDLYVGLQLKASAFGAAALRAKRVEFPGTGDERSRKAWWQPEELMKAPAGAPRAHRMGLARSVPRRGRGHALVRHRRHGGAPHRDQCQSIPAPMRCRSSIRRLALAPKLASGPGAAATIARVEPGGECLAIHARQVVEPDLQILRRHRRAVLPSLATSSTNHGRSPSTQMGAWVDDHHDRWYQRCPSLKVANIVCPHRATCRGIGVR